jgi:hypothetical protein
MAALPIPPSAARPAPSDEVVIRAVGLTKTFKDFCLSLRRQQVK